MGTFAIVVEVGWLNDAHMVMAFVGKSLCWSEIHLGRNREYTFVPVLAPSSYKVTGIQLQEVY